MNKALALAALAVSLSAAAPAVASGLDERYWDEDPAYVQDWHGHPHAFFAPSTAGAGPMGGYTVFSSDGMPVGTVATAEFGPNRLLDYVVVTLDSGRQIQVDDTGVSYLGPYEIAVAVSSWQLATASSLDQYVALEFNDDTRRWEDWAEAKGEAGARDFESRRE